MKPGEKFGVQLVELSAVEQLAELKEAGRLWIEDIDSLNHGLGSFRTERQPTKDLEAVFRRILSASVSPL